MLNVILKRISEVYGFWLLKWLRIFFKNIDFEINRMKSIRFYSIYFLYCFLKLKKI